MISVHRLTARRVADSGRVAMIMWSEGSSISFCRREGEKTRDKCVSAGLCGRG